MENNTSYKTGQTPTDADRKMSSLRQKKHKPVYYKAMTRDLSGYRGFRFKVGETYSENKRPVFYGFHYSNALTNCFFYYSDEEEHVRICEVEPLGWTVFHPATPCSFKFWSTDKIRIIRELSKEEIQNGLMEEQCPFWLLRSFNLPFEKLLEIKHKIRGYQNSYYILYERPDLTEDQKRMLLCKKYHRDIVPRRIPIGMEKRTQEADK